MGGRETGEKNVKKVKSAAPERSLATHRTPGSYHGPGGSRNNLETLVL